MKYLHPYQKLLSLLISCIFVLTVITQPADAGKGARTFAITLLASGLGLQVGSTFLNASAENKYEDYLSAVIQEDIQNQKSDVVAFKNASVSMSRAGYGFIGLAVIISIFDQLSRSSIDTVPTTQNGMNTLSNRIGSNRIGSNRIGQNNFDAMGLSQINSFFGSSKRLSLYPTYDFQEQRTGLQFIHRF